MASKLLAADAPPIIHRNLNFGTSPSDPSDSVATLCDLTIPPGDSPADGFPCVVVIHGGGWFSGDKWTMMQFTRPLVAAGFATMNINYRLAPAHPFPAQIDDLREALRWLVDQADRYSIDVDRIGLAGYSAGAQIALVIGTLADEPAATRAAASEWTADDQRLTKLPAIQAVFGGGSPCEFRTLPPDNGSLAYWLGGTRAEKPEAYRNASATAHASAGDPPILLVHGTDDMIVPIKSAYTMQAACQAAGGKVELVAADGLGHLLTFLAPTTSETMVRFFEKELAD